MTIHSTELCSPKPSLGGKEEIDEVEYLCYEIFQRRKIAKRRSIIARLLLGMGIGASVWEPLILQQNGLRLMFGRVFWQACQASFCSSCIYLGMMPEPSGTNISNRVWMLSTNILSSMEGAPMRHLHCL